LENFLELLIARLVDFRFSQSNHFSITAWL
jgi:hypothetical protein